MLVSFTRPYTETPRRRRFRPVRLRSRRSITRRVRPRTSASSIDQRVRERRPLPPLPRAV